MFSHTMPLNSVFTIVTTFVGIVFGAQIYPNATSLPQTIPQDCREALSANITCPTPLIVNTDVVSGWLINDTFLGEYCDCTCTDSLSTWAEDVQDKCGSTPYPYGNLTNGTVINANFTNINANFSVSSVTEPLIWAQEMACLTDKDDCDEYCLPGLINGTLGACDDCMLKIEAKMLDSLYGDWRIDDQTTITREPPAPYTPLPIITCNSGEYYEVQANDTCESVADDFAVALDRFLYQNSLDFRCTSLPVGAKVCIQECCTLHKVASGETCRDILKDEAFTLTELLAWNPILYRDCSNIDALVNRTICISPPGTAEYDVDVRVNWTTTWTIPGNWEAWSTLGTNGTPSAAKEYWPEMPTVTMAFGDPTASSEAASPTPTTPAV
ncbi:putative LysM domain-containing protein [Seiridium cardinale]|uniref:LysM domain-containing protein n=1 Tax=Seiridium cardinale TaxID=138064 RepID=A0ABR2XMH2_9PEZI